jgi:hypothetical protein
VPNPGLDIKTYSVKVVAGDGMYLFGLLCPHIFRVMVLLNVQKIPERYMLDRWSSETTTPAPTLGTNGIRFGVPSTNTLKYNSLCRKMNDLASNACVADDTYALVSTVIDEANQKVATMRKSQGVAQN